MTSGFICGIIGTVISTISVILVAFALMIVGTVIDQTKENMESTQNAAQGIIDQFGEAIEDEMEQSDDETNNESNSPDVTKIAVGPSAPPIIPIDAEFLGEKTDKINGNAIKCINTPPIIVKIIDAFFILYFFFLLFLC